MDLHYSVGARGARSAIVCRGSFENIPHCPPTCLLQCSQRQQPWPATTNHQAEQGLSDCQPAGLCGLEWAVRAPSSLICRCLDKGQWA